MTDILQTGHRRDFQGPRHDSGMGGSASHIDGKSEHAFSFNLGGICGREVVSDNDGIGRELMDLAFRESPSEFSGRVHRQNGCLSLVP